MPDLVFVQPLRPAMWCDDCESHHFPGYPITNPNPTWCAACASEHYAIEATTTSPDGRHALCGPCLGHYYPADDDVWPEEGER